MQRRIHSLSHTLSRLKTQAFGLVAPRDWVDFFYHVGKSYDSVIVPENDNRHSGNKGSPRPTLPGSSIKNHNNFTVENVRPSVQRFMYFAQACPWSRRKASLRLTAYPVSNPTFSPEYNAFYFVPQHMDKRLNNCCRKDGRRESRHKCISLCVYVGDSRRNQIFFFTLGDRFSLSLEASILRGDYMVALLEELGINIACLWNCRYKVGFLELAGRVEKRNFVIAITHMRLVEDLSVLEVLKDSVDDSRVYLLLGGHDYDLLRRYEGELTYDDPTVIDASVPNSEVIIGNTGMICDANGAVRIVKSGLDWKNLSLVRL
ncbi:hypothetical protein J3E72DRAFT_269379 [Bipolaris maydis]|nr:hypothetical protein J3E72DRAFT_269379 [Bipolaris maydis]